MTLKLKRTPGLYLVGFMGTGKSAIGAALAEELGWRFVDVDAEIEREEQTSISSIFQDRGERAFRDLETAMIGKCVKAVEAGSPTILALGGGAFVQPRNWELLENNGVTVWIDCPLDVVRCRLDGDETRPLARDPEAFSKLFEDRRPLYSRADYRIEVTHEDIPTVVKRILELPLF